MAKSVALAPRTRTVIVRTGGRRRSGSREMTFPVAVLAGLAPGASYAYEGWQGDGFRGVSRNLSMAFTGYDPVNRNWKAGYLMHGAVPALLGGLAHKFIGGKMGLNAALARARVPFIRI